MIHTWIYSITPNNSISIDIIIKTILGITRVENVENSIMIILFLQLQL